jgi:hypothetical protein
LREVRENIPKQGRGERADREQKSFLYIFDKINKR